MNYIDIVMMNFKEELKIKMCFLQKPIDLLTNTFRSPIPKRVMEKINVTFHAVILFLLFCTFFEHVVCGSKFIQIRLLEAVCPSLTTGPIETIHRAKSDI